MIMGDPPKLRNKYERPKRLWDVDRIAHDGAMKKEYGLKNMRELWISDSELRKYRREARRLLSLSDIERKADEKKVLAKLVKMGILKESAVIDDVLGLKVRDILERRLQTLVVRKGLAKTMRQSRQLITHGFISVSGRRVHTPSFLVIKTDEPTLGYAKPIDLSVKEPEPAPAEEKKPAPAAPEAAPKEAPKES
jgi:small subunit ribosomal protein S4